MRCYLSVLIDLHLQLYLIYKIREGVLYFGNILTNYTRNLKCKYSTMFKVSRFTCSYTVLIRLPQTLITKVVLSVSFCVLKISALNLNITT